MKLYLFFTLFICSTSFAQKQDTVFLKRRIAHTPYPFYHAVFIETRAKFKDQLVDFSFKNFDTTTYFGQLARLRPLKRSRLVQKNKFPRKWVALYSLKGKYYLYRPSDFGYHFRFKITDSTTIDFTMEGPEPSRLNRISFSSPTKVIIERTNHWEGKLVYIHVVNVKKGIAVFTFSPTKYNKKGYQLLMLDAEKAHLYPTIVNFCPTEKQPEFNFDKVNFKSPTK